MKGGCFFCGVSDFFFYFRLICQKFVQKGSTGDVSGFPFVCGFLSCSLWLRYGFLIHENSIILVNTIGATLHLAYVVTFYAYSIKKVWLKYFKKLFNIRV